MVTCTIVIPTHNRDDLLVRAVRSALQACPANGEVLVVDDKSCVPAAQVLASETDARLRVIVNVGANGASTTRNLGVACSAGEVIFFLDDDDEILPDYCARVLSTDGPVSQARWGFSSTLERREGLVGDVLRRRKRLARGLVPRHAPVREAVAATSGGFWIHRSGFVEAGGLDADQSIDEDTDLCVRLLALGSRPWYEEQPGVRLYRGYAPARPDGAQLTAATPADCALRCYRRTHDKNAWRFPTHSAYRWFLATRYLRRAVKGGQQREAWLFVNEQASLWFSACLKFFLCIKWLRHTGRRIGVVFRACGGLRSLPSQ